MKHINNLFCLEFFLASSRRKKLAQIIQIDQYWKLTDLLFMSNSNSHFHFQIRVNCFKYFQAIDRQYLKNPPINV